MNHFIFLRGNPGVGKITVARIIQEQTGFKLFWFHDLKNAIYDIVGDHRIPRLMDQLTLPVIEHMMERNHNIIYVRPAPERKTVDAISSIVHHHSGYQFHPVLLTAEYQTLVKRISAREDPYRIQNARDLDSYLGERQQSQIDHEHVVSTEGIDAHEVANRVLIKLNLPAN